jgi:hypothetical protein
MEFLKGGVDAGLQIDRNAADWEPGLKINADPQRVIHALEVGLDLDIQ